LKFVPFRSWFIGDTVESNGKVYLATHFDAVLLLLPYLRAAKRPQPVDQVVTDPRFPQLDRLVSSGGAITRNLDRVAVRKGAADLNVWQYDETRYAITHAISQIGSRLT
jgi:hypothetical protein